MRKLKLTLSIILAVLIISLGAALPIITAAFQDHASVNQLQYEQVSSVELAFAEEESQLSIMGKLNIFKYAGTIQITEKDASMTAEEALAAFYTELQPYLDTELIPVTIEYTDIFLCPQIMYNQDNPREYITIWVVDMATTSPPYQSLSVSIDDETGKLLNIGYHIEDESLDHLTSDRRALLLSEIFFNALGISLPDTEGWTERETTTELQYDFESEEYGNISVGFAVYANGFYLFLK